MKSKAQWQILITPALKACPAYVVRPCHRHMGKRERDKETEIERETTLPFSLGKRKSALGWWREIQFAQPSPSTLCFRSPSQHKYFYQEDHPLRSAGTPAVCAHPEPVMGCFQKMSEQYPSIWMVYVVLQERTSGQPLALCRGRGH